MTDEKGKFIFTPDFSQGGDWTVKVRSAGHGGIVYIPVESLSTQETNEVNSSQPSESRANNQIVKSPSPELEERTSSPTMLQKLMMAATGVWGFVGTALFFSRKKF
jgi:nickel transport protein